MQTLLVLQPILKASSYEKTIIKLKVKKKNYNVRQQPHLSYTKKMILKY